MTDNVSDRGKLPKGRRNDASVKITSEGVNALADFPHTRPDCVVKVGPPP